MYKRLLDYIEKNNILYKDQYGFRSKCSTSLAIMKLTEKIKTAIENNEFTIGIFLDLSKAFDTVNHSLLIFAEIRILWHKIEVDVMTGSEIIFPIGSKLLNTMQPILKREQ